MDRKIIVRLRAPRRRLRIRFVVPEAPVYHVPYSGPYEVIPSTETQILPTAEKALRQNVVVQPIPSNYGLISWNGATLGVS